MSLYTNTFRDICRPFLCYDGGLTWRTLNFVHGIWWVLARRQQIIDETDKASLVAQFFLQNSILGNIVGFSMAKILLTIIKIEDIFTAYNACQEAHKDIILTWQGAYRNKNERFYRKWKMIAYKVFVLIKSLFFFVMTWIDCGFAINFGSRAQFEATLRLKNNLQRVGQLIYRDSRLIRKSLHQHKGLIKLVFQKNDTAALHTMGSLASSLESIQNNTLVKGCKVLYEQAQSIIGNKKTPPNSPTKNTNPNRFLKE